MEPKFQTSFIPKKQVPTTSLAAIRTAQPKHGTSVFMVIAVIFFIISLVGVGGAYLWKQYLTTQQETYKKELADREKQFNTDLIGQLKQANFQIDTARQLLMNHIAFSGIFDIISRFTIANVRFLNMSVTRDPLTSLVKLTMSGEGTNLATVAFQSDVFSNLETYGLRKIVKNPALTNPSLGSTGLVTFSLAAEIDPSTIMYEHLVTGDTGSNASTTP